MPRRPCAAGPGDAGAPAEKACSVPEGVQRLVQLLPKVMRGLRRGDRPADTALRGLGPRHRSTLALVREQDMTVGALAAALDLTLPTVSGLVGDLERVGFIARSADPTDRRRTLITLVDDHRRYVDDWLAGASAPVARVLEQLSPEERSVFVRAMRLLDAELSRAQT